MARVWGEEGSGEGVRRGGGWWEGVRMGVKLGGEKGRGGRREKSQGGGGREGKEGGREGGGGREGEGGMGGGGREH